MNPVTINEVKELVSNQFSVKIERISESTRLGHDLGMTGDDAWEFMQVYAERFGVDMTDFEFNLHFGEEAGSDPFTLLFFLIFKSKRPKSVPISINDLAISADNKRWIRPTTEPSSV